MKQVAQYCLIVAVSFLMYSCKSKEDKAEELVRTELSKTLYDFDSYQPIETKVSVAKCNIYNDTACWRLGHTLAYGMEQFLEYKEKIEDAREHMSIWGRPTYYSSSYSDNKYYKYKAEAEDAVTHAMAALMVNKQIADELRDSAIALDTTRVIGWEVIHDFRCKTRGGSPEIGHYRYVISKDFKTVYICEDIESSRDKHTREALETILTDYWDMDDADSE